MSTHRNYRSPYENLGRGRNIDTLPANRLTALERIQLERQTQQTIGPRNQINRSNDISILSSAQSYHHVPRTSQWIVDTGLVISPSINNASYVQPTRIPRSTEVVDSNGLADRSINLWSDMMSNVQSNSLYRESVNRGPEVPIRFRHAPNIMPPPDLRGHPSAGINRHGLFLVKPSFKTVGRFIERDTHYNTNIKSLIFYQNFFKGMVFSYVKYEEPADKHTKTKRMVGICKVFSIEISRIDLSTGEVISITLPDKNTFLTKAYASWSPHKKGMVPSHKTPKGYPEFLNRVRLYLRRLGFSAKRYKEFTVIDTGTHTKVLSPGDTWKLPKGATPFIFKEITEEDIGISKTLKTQLPLFIIKSINPIRGSMETPKLRIIYESGFEETLETKQEETLEVKGKIPYRHTFSSLFGDEQPPDPSPNFLRQFSSGTGYTLVNPGWYINI